MTRNFYTILAICLLTVIGGCAQITETSKVILGSSTRALEKARGDAIAKTYHCSFNSCFDAVLSLSQDIKGDDASRGKLFDIFIDNRDKKHIVVMGIEGNVDTTEVGIFFIQPNLTTIKVEISSLSSSAKRTVAQAVFDELDLRFSAAH